MKNVIFDYNEKNICLQCRNDDKMKDIFEKFSYKIGEPLDSLYFLYCGNRVDENLILEEILVNNDEENKEIKILACKYNEHGCALPKKKSKQVICPTCGEPSQMKIKNYKISIFECKNQHKKDDLNLDEFEKSQLINESKIICNRCKENNKGNSYKNIFYLCNNCKLNLCPLCKFSHDKAHDIIDYEYRFSKCGIHNELFSLYCKTCHKNICTLCEQDHDGHEFISFGKLIIKENDLENKLEGLKISIDKFKEDIEKIRSILKNVSNYCEKLYKIFIEIAHNFDMKNRNYQNLCNLIEIYNEDISKKLDNIINSENYIHKITEIFKMYNDINNMTLNIDDSKKIFNESEENMGKKEKELKEEISKKNSEIEKLLSFMPLKLNHGENLMSIIFISDDQRVHYSFVCKNTDKFKDLESKLYKIYPEYSKTDNYFLSNGRTIIKSKDLEFNKIKNSDIITLYCDDI